MMHSGTTPLEFAAIRRSLIHTSNQRCKMQLLHIDLLLIKVIFRAIQVFLMDSRGPDLDVEKSQKVELEILQQNSSHVV